MAQSEDGFLSRWARRKEEARDSGGEAAAPEETQAASGTALGAPPGEVEDPASIVDTLPDIDSLDETSDFSVFMQKGVPQELRSLALRKLWRINPIFNLRDGLNDYDLDYRAMDAAVAAAGEGIKTLYQIGKGMVRPEAEEAKHAPDAGEEKPAAACHAPLHADGQAAEPLAPAGAGAAARPERESDGTPEERRQDRADTLPPSPSVPAQPTRASAAARRWGRFTT